MSEWSKCIWDGDEKDRDAFSAVMPALVAGIHVFLAGSQDVDGRDKPGHDEGWMLH